MRLVRFRVGRGEPRSGVLDDPSADATKSAVITGLAVLALPDLLGLPLGRIREICQNPGDQTVPARHAALLAPVSGRTEVWAAGVTYERSLAARMAESEHSADIYDRVYAAERPELFFKSAAWRVCGPGAPVSVRADSSIDIPEPELAVVLNYAGEVAGYTICNDMSSRSIEGENPLYLPQAKIYLGGCAVGPWIRPAWEVPDPYALTIEMTITRGDAVAWQGTSSTSGLRRRIDELVAYLFREDDFPAGVVLSTGTSLVPDLPFTLQAGDEIRIKISEIGELVNPVVRGKAAVAAAVHADASDKLTKDSHPTSSAAESKVSARQRLRPRPDPAVTSRSCRNRMILAWRDRARQAPRRRHTMPDADHGTWSSRPGKPRPYPLIWCDRHARTGPAVSGRTGRSVRSHVLEAADDAGRKLSSRPSFGLPPEIVTRVCLEESVRVRP